MQRILYAGRSSREGRISHRQRSSGKWTRFLLIRRVSPSTLRRPCPTRRTGSSTMSSCSLPLTISERFHKLIPSGIFQNNCFHLIGSLRTLRSIMISQTIPILKRRVSSSSCMKRSSDTNKWNLIIHLFCLRVNLYEYTKHITISCSFLSNSSFYGIHSFFLRESQFSYSLPHKLLISQPFSILLLFFRLLLLPSKNPPKISLLIHFQFFEWFHSFIFLLHSLLLPVWSLQWKPSTSRNSTRTPLSPFAVLPLLLAMISSGIRSSCSRTL